MITAKAIVPDWPFEVQASDPSKILVLTREEERKGPYFLIGDPAVQVATRPLGSDAVELVWEVNDLLPYDGRRYQSVSAAFTPYGQGNFLKDKSFEILTSTDGKNFAKIATVQGPTNKHLHEGVKAGRLYYYKVRALDKDGKLIAESPATMGAAGPNLFKKESFKKFAAQPVNERGTGSVVKAQIPYSETQDVVHLEPTASYKQPSFYGNVFPISSKKTYLQGGWIRAPGDVWLGRWFYDHEKKEMVCWGYSMMAVRNTPEWTFAVQLLMLDKDGTGTRRRAGNVHGIVLKQWTFPPEAGYMAVFATAFGPGEAGDFWVVEIDK